MSSGLLSVKAPFWGAGLGAKLEGGGSGGGGGGGVGRISRRSFGISSSCFAEDQTVPKPQMRRA